MNALGFFARVEDDGGVGTADHQKEVPRQLQHMLHVIFPTNEALLSSKLPVSSTSHEGLLEFSPCCERNGDHTHSPTPSSSRSHVDWTTLLFFKCDDMI